MYPLPRAPVQAPGWIAAAELIGLIFGDPEAKVWFQTFDDHGDNQDLALSKRGRLSDEAIRTWLTGAAKAGAGVFYAPATIGPEGRRAKFTTGYVCNYLDLDGSPLPLEWPGGIEPDIIVQSSDGRYHCYWLLVPGADLDTWRDVQARIAAAHKGDTSMTKPNGVLRLAGFFHQKGKPQRVTIDPGTTVTRRPLSDMVAAYAHVTDYEAPRSRTTSGAAGDVEDDDSPANVEGARREIARLPKPAEGNRNNIGFRVAATCDDYALSRELAIELATEWSESLPDPLDADEIVSLVDHAREYKDSPRGIKKSIDAVDDFADAPAIDPDEIVISGKMPAHVPELRVARSRIIKPTPFVPRDPRSIPLRPFIYDPYYVRGMVTLTAAMGGVGKSSLVMAENVAMALGKPLLGYQPEEDLVVWYFNGEDGQD